MRPFTVLLIAVMFAACSQSSPTVTQPEKTPMPRDAEADALVKRLKDEGIARLVDNSLKTLTTDVSDYKQADAVMTESTRFVGALQRYESGDPGPLERYGGIAVFKEKCAEWLNNDSQSIRTYAIVMLGTFSDKKYAPPIAALLKAHKYQERDTVKYDRGRAAIALGLMGADEYKAEIAKLLTSAEYNDRQGAALGLGFLKAKEFAPEVAKLQGDKEANVRNDARAALKLMGAEELIKK